MEQLKKINEWTFQEIASNTSRPLEWRRFLNYLNFYLTDVSIERGYKVCEAGLLSDFVEKSSGDAPPDPNTFPQITDAPSKTISIVGTAVIAQRDTLLVADGGGYKEPDDGIYRIRRPKLPPKIVLTGVTKSAWNSPALPNCNYRGGAYWYNDPSYFDDRIDITCEIPAEHANEIIDALAEDPSLVITVGITTPAFTNEMDDALREHWMPRDIIISGHEVAVVTGIKLARRKIEDVEESEPAEDTDEPEPPQEKPPAYVPLMGNIEKRLAKFSTPLWIISGLLLLHLLK